MNTVAIIFSIFIIISIPVLMIIVGALLLGPVPKFMNYKTKKSCKKALENMKETLNNNDKCPAWDGVECRNGIYNKSSGKCSTRTKSNIGRLLIILGFFIVLPLSIIIIILILLTHNNTNTKSMTPSMTPPSMTPPSMTPPSMTPSMSPSMSAGMTPYY
jgi:hypothetical protein